MANKRSGKKPKKNKGKAPKNKSKRSGTMVVARQQVEPCILHYAAVLADPIRAPSGACVPSMYVIPSVKYKSQIFKGQVVVGTGGVGYLVLTTPSPTQSRPCAKASGATYAGTQASSWDDAAVGDVDITFASLSPTYSPGVGVPANCKWKMVGFGCEITYTGTAMQAAGTVHTFHNPNNEHVLTGDADFTWATIVSYPTTVSKPVGVKTVYRYTWFPQDEVDYDSQITTYIGNDSAFGHVGGFVITGGNAADGGGVFDYQFCYHWEVINNSNQKTKSHSAPDQLGKVVARASTNLLEQTQSTVMNLTRDIAKTGVSAAGDYADSYIPEFLKSKGLRPGKFIADQVNGGMLM